MNATYWQDIPTGKANAATYEDLCLKWNKDRRTVRAILHDLSLYDSGDDYILIRSSNGKGFYKTDNIAEIEAYKRECLSRGRNVFAPLRKINRVLSVQDVTQYAFENNMRLIRTGAGMSQSEVCEVMQKYDTAFDAPLLSRYENGVAIPTPMQRFLLAQIYDCEPLELISIDLY